MPKIKLPQTASDPESRKPKSQAKVASQSRKPKSIDLNTLLVTDTQRTAEPKGKTSEAQRKAIAKYEQKYKRINCRLTPMMYQQIQNTGKSANAVIVEALTAYFSEK